MFSAIFGMGALLNNRQTNYLSVDTIAMICLIVSGFCDMFDGTIARMCKRTEQEKEFGVQLDSLADTVAFVAYPAMFLLFKVGNDWITTTIACLYGFSGIMRLGWFNITTGENHGEFFGLPVTLAAAIFPLLHFAILWFNIPAAIADAITQSTFAIVSILFISNFQLRKPGMLFKIIMSICAVAAILILLIV